MACDCRDNLDDALFFRFNLDTTVIQGVRRGFLATELDSVYIRRVSLDTAQRPRADTVLLTDGRRRLVQTFIINNAAPFTQSGTRKLDAYTYKIYLGKRRVPTDSFLLKDVLVDGGFEGDGCCSCYQNTQKELTLDGQRFDLANRENLPDTVLLSRRP